MLIKAIKKRLFRRYVINLLEKSEPEKIENLAKEKLLPSFKRAAERVPAYNKILHEKNIKAEQVNSLEDFAEKVPILKKEDLFPKFKLKELCINGKLPDDFVSAFTSSGFSGVFSYGITTKLDDENIIQTIKLLFGYEFDSENKRTLFINSQAMGVTFPSPYPMINTGVRADMVLASIKIFKKQFEQFIVFSEPHFAKKIIEEGVKEGFDWKSCSVSFVLGADYCSDSLIRYLKSFITGKICLNFGLSELGLNLFYNNMHLNDLRSVAQKDKSLREALFGDKTEAVPEIMYYFPNKTFIETTNNDKDGFGEFVFSMLDKELKMPLIRYNSKDFGKIISFNKLKETLIKKGYSGLIPKFKLPVVGVFGRSRRFIEDKGKKIFVIDVEEALYRDFSIAKKITGYFRVSSSGIDIQLKENINSSLEIKRKIEKLILGFTGKKISVKVYSYQDFPYGMALDYESKFKFI